MRKFLMGMAAVAASVAAVPASAAEVLSEGFNDISALSGAGWVITNQSTPVGVIGWFQGNEAAFTAQAGADNSYLGSNFNASTPGGQISNWLITPLFSTATGGNVSFWLRGDLLDAYQDLYAYGFSTGSSVTSDFAMSSAQIVPQGEWNLVNVAFAAQGDGATGRFAIAHVGPEARSNYIGVDSLSINALDATAAVPEPATWMMMIVGFGLVASAMRRRRMVRFNFA